VVLSLIPYFNLAFLKGVAFSSLTPCELRLEPKRAPCFQAERDEAVAGEEKTACQLGDELRTNAILHAETVKHKQRAMELEAALGRKDEQLLHQGKRLVRTLALKLRSLWKRLIFQSCFIIRSFLLQGDESHAARFATPADFLLQDCSPFRGLHVRRDSLSVVLCSRAILCRYC
jgi:hypothetical protein